VVPESSPPDTRGSASQRPLVRCFACGSLHLLRKITREKLAGAPASDLSIPVAARIEAADYSGWSEKNDRLFVQPPLEVLEQSVVVRVHLDVSDEETGALKVVPHSHTLGRLRPQ
jgi:hypothetical protein